MMIISPNSITSYHIYLSWIFDILVVENKLDNEQRVQLTNYQE